MKKEQNMDEETSVPARSRLRVGFISAGHPSEPPPPMPPAAVMNTFSGKELLRAASSEGTEIIVHHGARYVLREFTCVASHVEVGLVLAGGRSRLFDVRRAQLVALLEGTSASDAPGGGAGIGRILIHARAVNQRALTMALGLGGVGLRGRGRLAVAFPGYGELAAAASEETDAVTTGLRGVHCIGEDLRVLRVDGLLPFGDDRDRYPLKYLVHTYLRVGRMGEWSSKRYLEQINDRLGVDEAVLAELRQRQREAALAA